ncbi:hypothetical protein ACFL3S_12080 [Gemmatimonadota bacterium]
MRRTRVDGFGTDVIAVACILGGAATAGALTLAMAGGGHQEHSACAVGAMEVSPRVLVSSDTGARVVVSVPNIRVHTDHDCAVVVHEDVQLRMEEARREVERARERVEEARERVERVRIRVRRQHMEEAAAQFEAQVLQLEPLHLAMEEVRLALEAEVNPEVQIHLEAKLQDLQEKIQKDLREKLEKSGGGTMR